MNISKTIREQRNKLSLSQEELGERVYVTRQTISSWENGKSYPDVHSLILLSAVFDMTIDNLVKGDVEIMEQRIEKADIRDMKRYHILAYTGGGVFTIVFNFSWFLGWIPGIVISALVFAAIFCFAVKAEKLMKQYDVRTYREIMAFIKGETLDEITKARESGKRWYQAILIMVVIFIAFMTISHIIWRILTAI